MDEPMARNLTVDEILSDIEQEVFKNEKMIDFVTKRGWLTKEMVMKFVLCEMDTKMRLMERLEDSDLFPKLNNLKLTISGSLGTQFVSF